MKKILSLLLILSVLLGTITLSSCKKGPNDPFISLKSRKARMVGDWIISKYKLEYTINYIDGRQDYYLLSQDGENIAETKGEYNYPSHVDTTWTWKGKVIEERWFNFDKHGKVTYKWHYKIDEMHSDPDDEASVTHDTLLSYERLYQNTGTWNFLYKIDDYKKKERIAIMWEYTDFEEIYNIKEIVTDENADDVVPEENNTSTRQQYRHYYANGEATETWTLDKLKNKELMMYRIIDNNTRFSQASSEIVNTTIKGREQYDLEQE